MIFSPCSTLSAEICPYCIEPFTNERWPWAHEGGGQSHPYHYECVKKWIEAHSLCPHCRTPAKLASPSHWKEKTVSCLKFAAKGLAASAITAGYCYLVYLEGSASVTEILKSRWILSAAICAALSTQQEIAPGRLHRLRSLLTATSVFVAMNAGAGIGAAAHSSTPSFVEASIIGACVGIGATILATKEYSSLKLTATSSAITGLTSAILTRAGVKEGMIGTVSGAMTGALSVGLSAISIPVAMATGRFLFSRLRRP
ncbi:MAG: hypothetical protein LLG04_04585 [Parachlamydia sp.]|nr:hypothetical protein [Parachlamydia sp.]